MEKVDLKRYETDASYRKEVVKEYIESSEDFYQSKLAFQKNSLEKAEKDKKDLIARLSRERSNEVLKDQLYINDKEGLVTINDLVVPFTSIKNAKLNIKENGNVCESVKVEVDVDDKTTDLILLNEETPLSSASYQKACEQAQQIIHGLGVTSTTAIPDTTGIAPVEDAREIHILERNIETINKTFDDMKNNKEKHIIAQSPRNGEFEYMDDQEFSVYKLLQMQEKIASGEMLEELKGRMTQTGTEGLAKTGNEKALKPTVDSKIGTSAGQKIGSIIMWIISVLSALLGLIILVDSRFAAAIVSVLVAVLVNPIFYKQLNKEKQVYPFWINYLVWVGGIILFFIVF